MQVIFAQFMKGNESGEITMLEQIERIHVMRNAQNYGFYHRMSESDKQAIIVEHNVMLEKLIEMVKTKACDLLILDEVTYPYAYGLADKELIEKLIKEKPEDLELVITGRNPDDLFVDAADYVTEMKCIRHPFEQGVAARQGIEY